MRSTMLALAFLIACEADGSSRLDARPADGPFDGGACGTARAFEGELVDVDSSTASFRGVFGARLTVQGAPSQTTTTPPNGRIAMCVPASPTVQLEVDAPQTYLDGVLHLDGDALAQSVLAVPISLRSFTAARAASFYAERGLVFDAAKAHVLVQLVGDRSLLALDRGHGLEHSASDDDDDGTYTWEAGAVGRYVLFPNVDAAQPTGTITGDTSGDHTIPLAAGKLALVVIHFVFL